MRRKRWHREDWYVLVEEFESSEGFTQEEFAQYKGVSVGTFRKWLYQIREENGHSGVCDGFVELSCYPDSQPSPSSGVRLIVGQRVVLEFDSLPDVFYLAHLLEALEG